MQSHHPCSLKIARLGYKSVPAGQTRKSQFNGWIQGNKRMDQSLCFDHPLKCGRINLLVKNKLSRPMMQKSKEGRSSKVMAIEDVKGRPSS